MSKIFGEFTNMDDLNKTAINLREAGEKEEIIILGQENEIPKDMLNKFINGEIGLLVKHIEVSEEQKCRVCGCTQNNACEGGCYWVEDTLCNKCVKSANESDEIVQQSDGIVHGNETSVEKLKRELEESKINSVSAAPIAKYLVSRCELDDTLSSRVLLKDKSLKDCFNYVYSEVKKKLNGNSGCVAVAEEEVYKIAEDYFILDNIEIESKVPEEPNKKEVIKEVTKLTESRNVKIKKNDIKNKETKEKEILNVGQVSLFDF